MNNYLNILIESAWTASLIPLGSEPTFFAMQAFGDKGIYLAAAVAVVGATCGQIFNWWVGTRLLKLQQKKGTTHAWNLTFQEKFNKYFVYILLFSWMPLGKMLPVIAGFLGTRARVALLLIFLGQIFNYGRYIL